LKGVLNLRKLSNEEFLQRLEDMDSMAMPLAPYKNRRSKMPFMCKRNNEHIWEANAGNVLEGYGCPYCRATIIGEKQKGKHKSNALPMIITAPEMVEYLTNKEDALNFTMASRDITSWTCPLCKYKFDERIAKVHNNFRTRGHFVCPCCSAGRSYPNRLMSEVLNQLQIDYISEYNQEWTQGKRYDFYFVFNDTKYIIEMDGGFHKENTLSKQSIDEINATDKLKDKLALEHNITLIRIDCCYCNANRLAYIQNNILKKLSFLFDFSKVDFNECDKRANISTLKLFSEAWEKYKDVYLIEKELHYGRDRVIYYLKLTEKYNISSYCFKEDSKKRKDNFNKVIIPQICGYPVRCIETGEIFQSMKQASKKYNCCVKSCFKNKIKKWAGELPDGTKLHWEKLNKQYS
jgi:very-short-patch-repair endonuclease